MTLNELAERCEATQGPDRALDGLIHVLVAEPDKRWIIGHKPGRFPQEPIYGTLSDFAEWAESCLAGAEKWERSAVADSVGSPAYTASLDAAMTLVPEGWFVDNLAQNRADLTWWCALVRPVEGDEETGKITRDTARESSFDHATPALALCAAALRARSS